MNGRLLKELQRNKRFRNYFMHHGMPHKKNTLLILILIALIIYFIFTKANIYLIIGLTVLLILLMR